MSLRWCSSDIALFIRRSAVPMEIGRFFFRSLMSLWSAVKHCDPKFDEVVGGSSLLVVMLRIWMKVSGHVRVLSSCRLFLVSAHARMKSVLCVNGPGTVPFLMLRNARIVESRLMGCCWI
jgi:hypothetical protein